MVGHAGQLKIDTHYHLVPEFYAQGNPSASESIMWHLGIKTAILSVTAPDACILKGQESYKLAHTQASLDEISYALDILHTDGVYLSHPSIEPIWAELNRRRAIVFVHPIHPSDLRPINARMPLPLIDYPHETTRTVMDMITSGTRSKYPDCTVILSHAGGTLPYLISRVVEPLKITSDAVAQTSVGTTAEQASKDFKSFHYDLALSTSHQVLRMVLELIPRGHILHGVSHHFDVRFSIHSRTDLFVDDLVTFKRTAQLREKIIHVNAEALFARLARRKESGKL
ncbi:hypothetical protein BCR34DRAFT_625000 [Clohesyomyces aquaticus]|uniref:6-methylsalicylate decarboxylase n=1 Tax=Clohesyomyces aquaticus TaxID=1231657 RepID=A0A1Y1ZLE0_9PLEO|nr:hypothetical protein BCR34DRAFT_625000 [Clohesyomyces aquaticus]